MRKIILHDANNFFNDILDFHDEGFRLRSASDRQCAPPQVMHRLQSQQNYRVPDYIVQGGGPPKTQIPVARSRTNVHFVQNLKVQFFVFLLDLDITSLFTSGLTS